MQQGRDSKVSFLHLKIHIHSQLKLWLKLLFGVRNKIPEADIRIIQILIEFKVLSLWRYRPVRNQYG